VNGLAGHVLANVAVSVEPLIANVTEQIAPAVLCAGATEVLAERPEETLDVGEGPTVHGDSANADETAALDYIVVPALDAILQRWQSNVPGAQLLNRDARRRVQTFLDLS